MNMWQFAATFFYLGKLPFAPGTWGSLGAMILWSFLPLSFSLQLMILILLFCIGIFSSKKTAEALKTQDPPEVVIDEALGMSIALFMLPHTIAIYSLAFILFRIFDILKPSFIYRVQYLPDGWGIMLDDILAGIITLLICKGLLSIT